MTLEQGATLRSRFRFACGYCGTTETSVGSQLTVDHYHPTSRGGTDDETNWVLCCFACNSFKGAFWSEDEEQRLLRLLQDDFTVHIEQLEGVMLGLTQRGQQHIERLHLNREQLIAQHLNTATITQLQERIRIAEERLDRALKRIESLRPS